VSRIGVYPVPVPDGVQCELDGTHLKVKGPKGTLEQTFRPEVTIALINNMVLGVSQGYERELQIVGVGYRANLQGKSLNMTVGYSHPITIEPPEGITFTVEGANTIKVSGIDKALVGQVAANIRALRKPEPYKGKGIKYAGEQIRRKAGKAAGK